MTLTEEELTFNQKEQQLFAQLPPLKLTQAEETELHHLLGKITDLTTPVCKSCHDCITTFQNNLSPQARKHALLNAHQAIAGLLNLLSRLLTAISNAIWRNYHENIQTMPTNKGRQKEHKEK